MAAVQRAWKRYPAAAMCATVDGTRIPVAAWKTAIPVCSYRGSRQQEERRGTSMQKLTAETKTQLHFISPGWLSCEFRAWLSCGLP